MTDTSSDTFKAMKARARKVRSRLNRRKDRAGGLRPPEPAEAIMLPTTSVTIIQKDSPPATLAVILTREDNWRSAGDIKATVNGRSLNDRVLSVILPSGERATAIIQPSEHRKFGNKKPVWIRKDMRGKHYVVIGRYSAWGVRHA